VIDEIAQYVCSEGHVVAFTGAGMSVESGIAPFTGPGGLWRQYNPEEFAHIETFRANPAKAWVLYKDLLNAVLPAQPHAGHYALSRLERRGVLQSVITQNVDGLHQKAGSERVIEFHGDVKQLQCGRCAECYDSMTHAWAHSPRCRCGGWLRPTFVLYGEPIPEEVLWAAEQAVLASRLLLVIGTACRVYPAALLPNLARRGGAKILEINAHERAVAGTEGWFLKGQAGPTLDTLCQEIERQGQFEDAPVHPSSAADTPDLK